mmetsp:Transcript_3394/g.3979  ORF Transcript_3394/g.3979 Transcript_3394/m.3979 type:complete len:110 (-) Transcript_3394:62-391(-)
MNHTNGFDLHTSEPVSGPVNASAGSEAVSATAAPSAVTSLGAGCFSRGWMNVSWVCATKRCAAKQDTKPMRMIVSFVLRMARAIPDGFVSPPSRHQAVAILAQAVLARV